jgi:hypothetical protein
MVAVADFPEGSVTLPHKKLRADLIFSFNGPSDLRSMRFNNKFLSHLRLRIQFK